MINKGESAKVLSGSCGGRAKWSLDTKTGLLSITGSGETTDYRYYSNAPWHEYRSKIKSLSIGDQITSIGNWFFSGCSGLTSVIIPNSITLIGIDAFEWYLGIQSTESEFISETDYCEREQSELLNDYIPEEEISHSNYYYDDDDYDYNDGYRKYGGYNGYDDETIDAAFEGDPSLTWNCD